MAKKASVDPKICVACGVCTMSCPRQAVRIVKGCYAEVDVVKCVGCGFCAKNCPAGSISLSGV